MDEQVAILVSHVQALATYAVIQEDQLDSLMEQVHALSQEARAAARNSAESTEGRKQSCSTEMHRLAEDARCVAGTRRQEDRRRVALG